MRARYTRSLGLPVLDEESGEVLGSVAGMLLNPDTGVVEGFFVRTEGFFSGQNLFLGSADILHWGLRITVRDRDVLSSPEERVRLQPLLEGRRPVIGQKIITESGRTLGRCTDVQFNTESFRLEWLFPRRFFRWGIPISAKQIVEVKTEGVIVKDPAAVEREGAVREPPVLVPPMPEAA
ncbi:MAG: hypothetical protein HOO67_03230 [Candidatus Peribacteraceae bacterium]|nr:hypothetical protein [Candidatus Peribacteraceae bacterium]